MPKDQHTFVAGPGREPPRSPLAIQREAPPLSKSRWLASEYPQKPHCQLLAQVLPVFNILTAEPDPGCWVQARFA